MLSARFQMHRRNKVKQRAYRKLKFNCTFREQDLHRAVNATGAKADAVEARVAARKSFIF
jgi:hypothetical protein